MTFLDRVLMSIAPERALRRVVARTKARHVMNYDAARKSKRTQSWRAPQTDADSAAYGSRSRLRYLSREFDRNRPYAARARSVVVNNVAGKGFGPAVTCDDPRLKTRLETLVQNHLMDTRLDAQRIHDLRAMQRVVMGTVFRDGEIIARRRLREGTFARGLALPFQVELLEVDCLDDTVRNNGANEVHEGIEYGPTGAVVAYHIMARHPGSLRNWDRQSTTRVPAADILHIRELARPGQTRGVPWLAPVMLKLGEIEDYQEAQILRQKIASLLAGVVSSDSETSVNDDLPSLKDLAPGTIVGMDGDLKIEWTDPPTVDGYDQFMRTTLSSIAVGLGLTYESLTGDLGNVNFSSGRMGRMEMDRNVEAWQHEILVAQFCNGIARWFREYAVLQRDISASAQFSLAWTPPVRPMIEPSRELVAVKTRLELGLTSRPHEQRQLGLDPAEVRREIAEDAAENAAAASTPSGSETDTAAEGRVVSAVA